MTRDPRVFLYQSRESAPVLGDVQALTPERYPALRSGELYLVLLDKECLARQVQRERSCPYHLGTRAGQAMPWAEPPKNRLYPGKELPRVERLGHVVISSEFQPHNPVRVLTLGGQHDYGY